MSGGVCEATAFAVFGYRTTGIAFPLGNYHNGIRGLRDPEGEWTRSTSACPTSSAEWNWSTRLRGAWDCAASRRHAAG